MYRKMHIPDDPLYLREVLFHAGRSRLSRIRHALRPPGRAGLLGPVVSGRRPSDRPDRGRIPVLSDGHRLASDEKAEFGEGSMSLANHPARACHRQRRLRRGDQSRRPRGRCGRRPRVLGRLFPRESIRRDSRPGERRTREESLVANCDMGQLEEVRRNWPFLRDRRIVRL